MLAVKNSMKRSLVWAPAAEIAAGSVSMPAANERWWCRGHVVIGQKYRFFGLLRHGIRRLLALPFALGRPRIRQRLAHHPPVHPELVRHPADRPNAELVFPADLFE
jgi:hypothetical protein